MRAQQLDLFQAAVPVPAVSTATISPCEQYRYLLTRTWSSSAPACFVMLNPSTADANHDDATIKRCIAFAKSWGCGGLVVVNLYAHRATDPAELWRVAAPIGPDNDQHILAAVQGASKVVAAWGMNAKAERFAHVVTLLRQAKCTVHCLGMTVNGSPKHPLYLPATAPLIPFA